jgi:hypothetical protein
MQKKITGILEYNFKADDGKEIKGAIGFSEMELFADLPVLVPSEDLRVGCQVIATDIARQYESMN